MANEKPVSPNLTQVADYCHCCGSSDTFISRMMLEAKTRGVSEQEPLFMLNANFYDPRKLAVLGMVKAIITRTQIDFCCQCGTLFARSYDFIEGYASPQGQPPPGDHQKKP